MMKTLILNGSPNHNKGNTEVFIQRFLAASVIPKEVRYVAKEDRARLAACVKDYDAILFFMPLYVHAMPGIVMRLLEEMEPVLPGKRIGFVVQYGFMEGAQSQYVKRYFESLADRLGFTCIGVAVRGGSAGVGMMPEKMNKKLFAQLDTLGMVYDRTGEFDEAVLRNWAEPYELSKASVLLDQLLTNIGVNNIFWHKMMKKKGGYAKKRDRPFGN